MFGLRGNASRQSASSHSRGDARNSASFIRPRIHPRCDLSHGAVRRPPHQAVILNSVKDLRLRFRFPPEAPSPGTCHVPGLSKMDKFETAEVTAMSSGATERNQPTRHVDKGTLLGGFASQVIVVCPKCNGPASVTTQSRYTFPHIPAHAKVVCSKCPFQTTYEESGWLGPGVGVAKERCPNCGFKWLEARVIRGSLKGQGRRWVAVRCIECQQTAQLLLHWRVRRIGDAVDPAFGLPLWLQSSCCGGTLWAYNAVHLRALRDYVAATIRERVGVMHWSMFSRLPKWLSAGKNRDTVLNAIDRLQDKLVLPHVNML
jgi:hypothetical protein